VDVHGIFHPACAGHTESPVAEITAPDPGDFVRFDGSAPIAVVGSALASIDVGALADGAYALRLTVTDGTPRRPWPGARSSWTDLGACAAAGALLTGERPDGSLQRSAAFPG
jgi:hypothetical protein